MTGGGHESKNKNKKRKKLTNIETKRKSRGEGKLESAQEGSPKFFLSPHSTHHAATAPKHTLYKDRITHRGNEPRTVANILIIDVIKNKKNASKHAGGGDQQ